MTTGAESRAEHRPKVSVLMIAYNVEPYLAQALDGVLMQQVDFDYEIIVGEDCSTDGTRRVLLEYAARYPDRIRPLLNQRNLGMNKNFMATLLALRGEFVALLDGDDYWTAPDKLQRQVDFLEANPQFSISFHNAMVVYEGQPTPPHPFHMKVPTELISHHVPKPVCTIDDLAGGNFMQTCSVLFRAGLYGELPDWYLSMPTFDWPLHLLNAEHGNIAYIDEVMSVYRVHHGSFWSTNMVFYRKVEDIELMIQAYQTINRYTGYKYDQKITGQVLPLYRRAAEVLMGRREYGRAFGYALKLLRNRAPEHAAVRSQSLSLLLKSLKHAFTR